MSRKPVSIQEELGYLERNSRPQAYFVESQQLFDQLVIHLAERLEQDVCIGLAEEAQVFLKQDGRHFLSALVMPDKKEITQHAEELAQALLSAWINLLWDCIGRAATERQEIIMEEYWFQSHQENLRGELSAFVLEPMKAVTALSDFVANMKRETKLSPEMTLCIKRGEHYVVFIPYQQPNVL